MLAKGHITQKGGPKELNHLSSSGPKFETPRNNVRCLRCKKMGHGSTNCRVHIAEKNASIMQCSYKT
jgi:hypothetical protein